MILDTVNRSIQVVLAGNITTHQLPLTAAWVDVTSAGCTLGSGTGATNNTTPVTAVAAPAASTQRQIKELTAYNADTVAATIKASFDDNGTLAVMALITLNPGDTLAYTDTQGFYVFDKFGNRKESGYGNIIGPNPTTVDALAAWDATDGGKLRNSTVLIDRNAYDKWLFNASAGQFLTSVLSGSTTTLDLDKSDRWVIPSSQGSDITVALTNATIGQIVVILVLWTNSGARTLAWSPEIISWAGNAEPIFNGYWVATTLLCTGTGDYGVPLFTEIAREGYNAQSQAPDQVVYDAGDSGTALTINPDNGQFQKCRITAAATITLNYPTNPGEFVLFIHQDGTGHNYTFAAGQKNAGGTIGTSNTANAVDKFVLTYDGSTKYLEGDSFS